MRRRLLLSSFGIVIVAVLVLGLPLLVVTVRLIDDTVHNDLLREVQTVSAYVEDRIDDHEPVAPRLNRLVPAGEQVQVVTAGGAVLSAGPNLADHTFQATEPLNGGGEVRVIRSAREVRSQQVRASMLVGALVLLSALVAAAVSVFSARRLTDPLLDVAARAARLGSGDFRPAPERHGIAELDRVADVLDRSAQQIADLLRRERDFASDVSHQLRTRLTALQMRLEEIALSDDESVRTEAGAALEQVERLSGVIDDLLAQARQKRASSATEIDVAQALRIVVDERAPAIKRLGRQVVIDSEPELMACATIGRLQQVVGVLVDNALEHGRGTVTVAARQANQHVVVEVTDVGDGVAPDLVPRLFQRGVSGAGGTGLGLALARALAEADGGRLELRRPRPPVFAVFLRRAATED
ncbi:MAG TPA: ATP-binding protein [Mycobacteriales bacterium]|nr:ATP-binding protein [Mycobacteriales bacterium]